MTSGEAFVPYMLGNPFSYKLDFYLRLFSNNNYPSCVRSNAQRGLTEDDVEPDEGPVDQFCCRFSATGYRIEWYRGPFNYVWTHKT
jgi:hypothetical protein